MAPKVRALDRSLCYRHTYELASGVVQVFGGQTLSVLYRRALMHRGIEACQAEVDQIGATYWNLAVGAGIVTTG